MRPDDSGLSSVDKTELDALIELIGRLVVTRSTFSLLGEHFEPEDRGQWQSQLAQLERHTNELRDSVMHIRMLPISFLFGRFTKFVLDTSAKLGKKIQLKFAGEHTEVDKSVIELIGDPLAYLIRHSLYHGIETPRDRVLAGKPETGSVMLNASSRGSNMVIEVTDDGRGINKAHLRTKAIELGLMAENTILSDKQVFDLLFAPGISVGQQPDELLDRPVSLNRVSKNLEALSANINILSEEGRGTTFSILFPLS